MLRQLINGVLLLMLLPVADSSRANSGHANRHNPALPRKLPEAQAVKIEVDYRFGDKTHMTVRGADAKLQQAITQHADRHIECQDTGEIRNEFDRALPVGWLYAMFGDSSTSWQGYFDTSASEIWVLPNVYCNTQRVLTAISWMRSGKKGSWAKNNNMAKRFKNNSPPFYHNDNLTGARGVFCNWQGWLYGKDEQRGKYIDTHSNDELFTMINIYCDDRRVTHMAHGYAGDKRHHPKASDKPFNNITTPATTDGISCGWQGWLLKDGTDGTYKDKDNNLRWRYEKYFALDERNTTESGKRRIHGRVINPYCSKQRQARYGKVTRLRAYCFYPSVWKNKNTCASLPD